MIAVTFSDALKVWIKIGCLSFGGPAGQIALMHREFVDERKWLTEKEYLSALNFCMLLPGPEAMQLATYVGWKMFGVRGGLAAGLAFVIPGALVVLALTMIYASFGQVGWIAALFFGVKAAVLAVVVEALLRVSKRALKDVQDWVLAGIAFVALFVFDVPFPVIIIAAAVFGWVTCPGDARAAPDFPSPRALIVNVTVWGAIWLVPLAGLAAALGPQHVFTEVGVFFSKLAVVTFGGAYAVLSYMSQAAVEQKQWLAPHEMIDGLGLAETTPGPLILVTEFVGYHAGLRQAGGVWGGLAAAGITLWMTFAPCFMFIFAGAPYIGAINARPRLRGALACITATVVGVILNLTVWFGLQILFGSVARSEGWFRPWIPDWSQLDLAALTLCALAGGMLLRLHFSLPKVLAICAVLGLVYKLAVT